jgi:hypothetical protein
MVDLATQQPAADLGRGVVRLDRLPDREREAFELGVRDPSRPARREAGRVMGLTGMPMQ